MPVETLSIQFTTTLWFDDVPGKFLDRVLVVARRLLLMSSSGIAACAFTVLWHASPTSWGAHPADEAISILKPEEMRI